MNQSCWLSKARSLLKRKRGGGARSYLFFLSTHLIAQSGGPPVQAPTPNFCNNQLGTSISNNFSLPQDHCYFEFAVAQTKLNETLPGSYDFYEKSNLVDELIKNDEVAQILTLFKQRINAQLREINPPELNPSLSTQNTPGTEVIFHEGIPAGLRLPVSQFLAIDPVTFEATFTTFSHLELIEVDDLDMENLSKTKTHQNILKKLSSLSVQGTYGDTGLDFFSRSFLAINTLKHLSLRGSFENNGANSFGTNFDTSHLETLDIRGHFNSSGYHSIVRGRKSLKALSLRGSLVDMMSHNILSQFHVINYPNLQSLSINGKYKGPVFQNVKKAGMAPIKNLTMKGLFDSSITMFDLTGNTFLDQLETFFVSAMYGPDGHSAIVNRLTNNPPKNLKALYAQGYSRSYMFGDIDFFRRPHIDQTPISDLRLCPYIVW